MTSSKQLSYTFTTLAATANFATVELSPTSVSIPTALTINDISEVAFWGVTSSLEAGIFMGDGDSLKAIADTSGEFSFLGVGSLINDRGTVAFLAGLDRGQLQIPAMDSLYSGVSLPSMVGERLHLLSPPQSENYKVLTEDGGRLTWIADSQGAFSSFRSADINNRGTVAYLANFDAGGSGPFVGKQQVIATGDELLGSTVTELNFLNKGFDRDSVAFWAELADGRSGVFRADVDKHSSPTSNLDPLYTQIERYTTTITADRDAADVYFPSLPKSYCHSTEFPIALMLQGALVDKSDYSTFASQVASYGFVVVVPNNERTLSLPNGQATTGLFAEQEQVNDVLADMKEEDLDASSPLYKIVDASKMGLLGHSFGGATGLGATQEEICVPGICSPDYTRPPELKAGIFYGTSFRDQQTGEFLPINNKEVAIGLIQGSLDGVASPINSEGTYDQLLNPPKALITVEGANHYGITNEDNLLREPNRPTLDQAMATGTIAQLSGLFLRANLLGDRAAFDAVFNANPVFDPNVSIISQTQLM